MTMFTCKFCRETFPTRPKLNNHHVIHVEKVFYGPAQQRLDKTKSGFECPICSKNLKSARTIKTHLETHDTTCEYTVPGSPISSQNEEQSDVHVEQQFGTNLSTFDGMSKRKMQSEEGNNPIAKQQKVSYPESDSQHDTISYDHAILMSSDDFFASDAEKQMKLAMVKVGGWTPVVHVDKEYKKHGFLGNASSVHGLHEADPQRWLIPVNKKLIDTTTTQSSFDEHLSMLIRTSPARSHLQTTTYQPLTKDIVKTLNEDWLLNPNMPHYFAQLFAGAVLITNDSALILLCLEPYGRSKASDAHHERLVDNTTSSFPKTQGRYGYFRVLLIDNDNSRKLVIGTRTGNLLITSSARLDKEFVNIGPTTDCFLPTTDPIVFLDKTSIEAANDILESDHYWNQVQQGPAHEHFRQLRSKFHHVSTYRRSRASLDITSLPSIKPATIWTLYDDDSPQQKLSQEKAGSYFFQMLGMSVTRNQRTATLIKQHVLETIEMIRGRTAATEILEQILEQFDSSESLPIIGNEQLNNKLTLLANCTTNAIKKINGIRVERLKKNLYS